MKLNEKEAVHCRTQVEFDKVIKEFNKHGIKWGIDYDDNGSYHFKKYKNIALLKMYGSIYFGSVEFLQEEGFKILTYSEFMGEEIKPWKPKTGENVWMITANDYFIRIKLEIKNIKYNDYKWEKDCFINGTIFRTRQLAREAKKAIEEALKKARKG